MKNAFQKAWNWWKKLHWAWKILGFVLLILIALLWVLSLFQRKDGYDDLSAIDAHHSEKVDQALNDLEKEREKTKAEIAARKKEIATKLNQASTIDAETLKRRERINAATTMEELDELQKELDL